MVSCPERVRLTCEHSSSQGVVDAFKQGAKSFERLGELCTVL